MATLGKIIHLVFFTAISLIFLPMVAVVHVAYGPYEKWFEKITKS